MPNLHIRSVYSEIKTKEYVIYIYIHMIRKLIPSFKMFIITLVKYMS